MQKEHSYDVIVVGASIAGRTAAALYAQEGLSVALLEQRQNLTTGRPTDAYYDVPAFPAAVIPAESDYHFRRLLREPLFEQHAAAARNIDLFLRTTIRELIFEGDRVVGLKAVREWRETITFRARLVVGADGRYSQTARAAGLPAETADNDRFIYYAYFRDLPLFEGQNAQVWMFDPGVAYAIRADDNLTAVAVALPKSDLAAFKQDVAGEFERFFAELPDGPNLDDAEQVSPLMGMLNMPVISRQTSAPGLALIGDAALAGDPVWGNGLGWAFQSASWLVEETALALASSSPRALDAALVAYSQVHRERRHGRFVHHVDCASIRPFNWLEKLFIAAVAKNPRLAAYTGPDALRHLQSSPPFNAHFEALTGASAPFQNARNLFRRLRFPARSTAHHLGQT